jgi:hypothetical protein
MKFPKLLFVALACSVLTTGLSAHVIDESAKPAKVGAQAQVQFKEAWVRATVPGQTGSGAFMKITSSNASRLVSVSTPVAGVAQVHEMKMDGDVMKMRALTDGVELPAGKTVELKSGGFHVMLMDLKQTLVAGRKVPLTLVFKDANGLETQLTLNLPVAKTAPMGAKDSMGAISNIVNTDKHRH